MLRLVLLIPLFISLASCGKSSDSSDTFPTLPFSPTRPISYNRDIRPILSNHCFRCHGPDEAARKRGLRLDTAEGSRALLKSKVHAIVPGDPDTSELINRITSQDPDDVMPPPELHLPLSAEQQQLLTDWIKQGANYEPHWAFIPPHKTPAPGTDAKLDEIDRFVAARLAEENLSPAPPADRATLLRRVSLALTGLPPTIEELDAFLADTAPDAYEKQVDRLLASPHYGERMAADWLDVARFADTYGYQSDWECRVWPWRDWLINSFNSNQPYNEFIRDQLAGDLLPDATTAQKIATAFNRLHRQTNEGGSIDEEFRREYISDRIATYSTAFLGLTVECARCHDHKYDPISQQDYYSLGAFFGAIDEAGTYPYATPAIPRPAMRLPNAEQQIELNRLREAVAAAEAARDATFQSQAGNYGTWLNSAKTINVKPPVNRFPLEGSLTGPTLSTGEVLKSTLLDGDTGPSLKDIPAFKRSDPRSLVFWMNCPDTKSRAAVIHTCTFTIESDEQGYQVMLKDGHLCWELIHYWPGSAAAIRTASPFPLNRWVQVAVTYDGSSLASGLHIYLDGQLGPTEIVRDHLDGPATARTFQVGFRDRDLGFKGGGICDLQIFDRALSAPEIAELKTPGSFTPATALNNLFSYYTNVNAECIAASKTLRDARAAYHTLLESIPEIMVMEETRYPRVSFILTRGQYDQPDRSRPVHPNRAIEALLPFNQSLPHNRLGLSNWTTDPHNPLAARVAVNRLWAICFSRGILPTLENFGLQSEPPSHPELLDNLTVDFVASNWNTKSLIRRMVLSQTFRQSSVATEQSLARDPSNALLSRGPSSRLSAEVLRDQALAASGLLATAIGGPSVKPWQPPGLWADSGVASQGDYKPDTGDNAHRRSVYTYRKRTSPPPNMLAFDAGSRELCLARRQPTNTPLQPLVLLNDPVFFECARALATRVTSTSPDSKSQITLAFRHLTSREPRQPELAALLDLYNSQLATLTADTESTQKLLASKSADPALASLTLVCSTILASDASITNR